MRSRAVARTLRTIDFGSWWLLAVTIPDMQYNVRKTLRRNAELKQRLYDGQRFSFDGNSCTVLYAGPVEGEKGIWLGVEWDDGSRGKHNGTYKGKSYFACRNPAPTAASFVRLERPTDHEVYFFEALERKYASHRETEEDEGIIISGKIVQEVGFEKVRRQLAILSDLKVVALNDASIVGVTFIKWPFPARDPREDFERDISRIRELKIEHLDLSRNLFESIQDIMYLAMGLKNLKSLRLNGNRFIDLSWPGYANGTGRCTWLEELSLDNTYLGWQQITMIVNWFPSLKTLSSSQNGLGFIGDNTTTEPIFNLEELDLSGNRIKKMELCPCIGQMQNLHKLSLRGNPLKSFGPLCLKLPNLRKLDLSETKIASFSVLNNVARLYPGLDRLLISRTPLSEVPSAYLLAIAHVSSLKELNHSHITPEERQNAEIYYMNTITGQLLSSSGSEETQSILNDHPRWAELCEIYGEPDLGSRKPEQPSDFAPGTLGARLANFTFKIAVDNLKALNIAPPDDQTDIKVHDGFIYKSKTLPLTTSLYRLQGIAVALFTPPIPYLEVAMVLELDELDPAGGRFLLSNIDDDNSADDDSFDDNLFDDDGDDAEIEKDVHDGEGKWIRREEKLVGSTRLVGDWLPPGFGGKAAEVRIRLELRSRGRRTETS